MSYRKLGRTSSQRKALLRDLTTDLIVNGSIKTTEARAKEVRKTADKMITLAKRGDLASRRQAAMSLLTLRKMATTFAYNQLCNTCLKSWHQSLPTVRVVTRGF